MSNEPHDQTTEEEIERLRAAIRDALAAFRLQGPDDHWLQAIGRASIILWGALRPER